MDDQVGFFAPQSKQILLASFRLSLSKRALDSAFVAMAMLGDYDGGCHVQSDDVSRDFKWAVIRESFGWPVRMCMETGWDVVSAGGGAEY